MNEPKRWRDDPRVSEELRAALASTARPRELDRVTRSRVGARLSRLGAVQLTAATWLTVKSAAALGILGGVAAAGTLAVAGHYQLFQAGHAGTPSSGTNRPKVPPALRGEPASVGKAPAEAPHSEPLEAPPSPSPAPTPALDPSTDLPRPSRTPAASVPTASASASLAEESRVLEQARRALASAPAAALTLVREHAARFPDGQLAAERRLLEVEALYRVGRASEARTLASRLLASGATGLYAERLQRLLRKIDGGVEAQ